MAAAVFRKCLNGKSRANPDIQCTLSASHGDYCSRHWKNPKPFRKSPPPTRVFSRSDKVAIKKIQTFWRRHIPLYRYLQQGPAANSYSLAVNDTELYSLDSIHTVPKHYFISFSDERKSVWAFDVRTIVQTMATGFPSENPYTREKLLDRAVERIHSRIAWLRSRKYPILHMNNDVLTAEQTWNHTVLNIFLKIEALGYYASCDWYHKLTLSQHMSFYNSIFVLWEYRLGLTRADKDRVVPGHENLFRFQPSDMPMKSAHWWEKNTLTIMEAFITRSPEKEQQKLGAMYVLMALTRVSRRVAEAFPWLMPE